MLSELLEIGHAEAEMGVFIVVGNLFGTLNHMQVALPRAKPGMLAIVEWLGYLFQPDGFLIEFGADLQALYIISRMVEQRVSARRSDKCIGGKTCQPHGGHA